jgi:aminopeptidase YwaD
MENFIREIIGKFGGRYFGSEEEKKAQEHVNEILKNHCDKTEITEFKSALEAHFQSFKIFIVVYVAILFLIKIHPLLAAIIGVLNAVLFLGHFVTYRHWLDFLFPKKPSYNVTGDVEPLEEATSTIMFAGHIDSVKEFKWWYKLKDLGIVLSVVGGFLIVLQGVFAPFAYFFEHSLAVHIIWWIFIIAAPSLIVCFDMHGKNVVEGANDNLTGVAMAVEMAKYFSENKLKNTRIRAISFGAEESGLRGAWAYAKSNKQKLLNENAILVNLDTIKDEDYLTIASSEVNTLCFFRKDLIEKMENSFKAMQTPVKILPLTVGASDASAFKIQGLPVISMIGMTTEKLDPTYHTRLDNTDHLDGKAMEKLKKVLIHFAETHDKQQSATS